MLYGRHVVQAFLKREAGTYRWLLVTENDAGDRQRIAYPTSTVEVEAAMRALATFVRQRRDIDGLHPRLRVREERQDTTIDRPEWAQTLGRLLAT